MRKLILHITPFFICLLFSFQIIFGQTFHKEIPESPNPPKLVNDFAQMLSPQETLNLEAKLLAFEKKTSNEITVVTVMELGDLDVATFAHELGRKWDIGKDKKRNGVILLASKNDRKINISPGYGLSGALPDITCNRIIRNFIVPNFRNENYYEGIDQATTAIMEATQGEFIADEVPAASGDGMFIFFLIFFMIIVFLFYYISSRRKGVYVSRRGYKYNDNGWDVPMGGFGGFGGFGGGNSGSSGDSGGFGGFGGGGDGFDGGGASGSW